MAAYGCLLLRWLPIDPHVAAQSTWTLCGAGGIALTRSFLPGVCVCVCVCVCGVVVFVCVCAARCLSETLPAGRKPRAERRTSPTPVAQRPLSARALSACTLRVISGRKCSRHTITECSVLLLCRWPMCRYFQSAIQSLDRSCSPMAPTCYSAPLCRPKVRTEPQHRIPNSRGVLSGTGARLRFNRRLHIRHAAHPPCSTSMMLIDELT